MFVAFSSLLHNFRYLRSRQFLFRMATYTVEESGALYSTSYKMHFKLGNDFISPFHDIPLYADDERTVLNMVVEIPRWTNAKMEICTSEPFNPIKQDVKKGNVRFVDNCFPYHGYLWNYGALPQTWEYPDHIDASTGCKGDNDPLDVCEIGSRVGARGEIKKVKVLGALALIDEGETDWKILVIDIHDEKAPALNDIEDVINHMPRCIEETVNWFKVYKMPTGKPPNTFAFNGQPKNKSFAMSIIEETHQHWRKLINKAFLSESINLTNSTLNNANSQQRMNDTMLSLEPPRLLPEKVHYQHHVSA